MLGVVLCGGQSTRMGSDKGLLKLHANNWAQIAIDKISSLQLPVVISVNKAQLEPYSTIFPTTQLITDNEKLPWKGPLCGLLSVHVQYPSEDLFILACDMPLMESELLKDLLAYYHQNPKPDAFIYSNDGEHEPLCGIYKSTGLSHIIRLMKTNQLSRHSMKYMLEQINTYLTPLPEDKKKCFRNFNAHAESNGL